MLIKNCKVTIGRKTFSEQTESNTLSVIYQNIDGNYYAECVNQGKDITQERVVKKARLLIPITCTQVQEKDEVEVTMSGFSVGKFIVQTIRPYVQFSDTLKLTLTDGEI